MTDLPDRFSKVNHDMVPSTLGYSGSGFLASDRPQFQSRLCHLLFDLDVFLNPSETQSPCIHPKSYLPARGAVVSKQGSHL